MSFYRHLQTGAVRQVDAELFAAWVSAGNPKAAGWTLIQDPPSPVAQWDGSQWVEPAAPVQESPNEVSMAQACIALHRAGKLELVPQIIASLEEPPRIEAGLWWSRATSVRKDHPIVQMLAPALGLDDAGLDDLFAVAASV